MLRAGHTTFSFWASYVLPNVGANAAGGELYVGRVAIVADGEGASVVGVVSDNQHDFALGGAESDVG